MEHYTPHWHKVSTFWYTLSAWYIVNGLFYPYYLYCFFSTAVCGWWTILPLFGLFHPICTVFQHGAVWLLDYFTLFVLFFSTALCGWSTILPLFVLLLEWRHVDEGLFYRICTVFQHGAVWLIDYFTVFVLFFSTAPCGWWTILPYLYCFSARRCVAGGLFYPICTVFQHGAVWMIDYFTPICTVFQHGAVWLVDYFTLFVLFFSTALCGWSTILPYLYCFSARRCVDDGLFYPICTVFQHGAVWMMDYFTPYYLYCVSARRCVAGGLFYPICTVFQHGAVWLEDYFTLFVLFFSTAPCGWWTILPYLYCFSARRCVADGLFYPICTVFQHGAVWMMDYFTLFVLFFSTALCGWWTILPYLYCFSARRCVADGLFYPICTVFQHGAVWMMDYFTLFVLFFSTALCGWWTILPYLYCFSARRCVDDGLFYPICTVFQHGAVWLMDYFTLFVLFFSTALCGWWTILPYLYCFSARRCVADGLFYPICTVFQHGAVWMMDYFTLFVLFFSTALCGWWTNTSCTVFQHGAVWLMDVCTPCYCDDGTAPCGWWTILPYLYCFFQHGAVWLVDYFTLFVLFFSTALCGWWTCVRLVTVMTARRCVLDGLFYPICTVFQHGAVWLMDVCTPCYCDDGTARCEAETCSNRLECPNVSIQTCILCTLAEPGFYYVGVPN